MVAKASSLSGCPECGSGDRERVGTDPVPGGVDWRYYACDDCGHEWRI